MQQSSPSTGDNKPQVKEQRYLVDNPDKAYQIANLVYQLNTQSRPWEVIIRPYQKKRTDSQNGLYWKWLSIIGDEIGYDKDDLHDIFREKFLPVKREVVLGHERKRLTSTSSREFTTVLMSEYMNHIERFVNTELGILLPHTDDEYHKQNIERMRLK